jgi:spermidine synthase
MAGLIIGAWAVTRIIEKGGGDYGLFIKTQISIFIYPLILLPVFFIFSNLKGDVSFWLGSNIVFPFLPIIPGLIGGFQFPLANKLYMESAGRGAGTSASLTYGTDLLGSCLGAILITVFFVPIAGIPGTCILLSALNLAGVALLHRYRRLGKAVIA